MKMASFGWMAVLVCGAAYGAGPTATPASLGFSYQVNSTTLPAAGKLTVALPSGTSSSTVMNVTVAPAQSWLAVTPDSGYSPLTMSVTVNPTGLAPGSYMGTITVNTVPPSTPAVVSVVLSISNPPSTLMLTSPSSNYATGSAGPNLSFTYTTGAPATIPVSSELDVASSGDIIPFNITSALASGKGSSGSSSTANWIRVNQPNQLPNTQTSGVALSGSYVPITVTLDPTLLASLDPGSYGGSITIAANSAANGSITVAVNLVISAGQPSLAGIYPVAVVAGPAVNPVVTIYGDNFFSTSVVTLQEGTDPAITLKSTLLSRKVLQATINAALLSSPGAWTLSVTNPAPPNNPSQAPVATQFTVISATVPAIISVVNAASYLPSALQTGTNADPVAGSTSVSPRQIISIFGQNLGPDTVISATPTGTPLKYPFTLSGVTVTFQVNGGNVPAPILMVSNNQINAIVPVGVTASLTGAVQVIVGNNGIPTAPFNLKVIASNPGVFTFGGLGQGQAAILNYDSNTGGYSINSSKAGAVRGSTILIYATGMGDFALQADGTAVPDGAVASSALGVNDQTVRVDIAGQPAVVSYAGACPGAVAGLVQINAIVPPTVATGAAVPITVSIGSAQTARRSQAGVTLVVK